MACGVLAAPGAVAVSERGAWAVFALFAAWLQVGPVCRQVLGWKEPWLSKAWVMYSTVGYRECVVAWYDAVDGELVPVDRIGELYGALDEAPRDTRWLVGRAAVEAEAAELCAITPRDLRADAWCAQPKLRGAWKQVLRPDEPRCSP